MRFWLRKNWRGLKGRFYCFSLLLPFIHVSNYFSGSVEDLLKRAGARPVKEMNSFSFGEAIKLEVKIPNAKQSAAIKLLKQLVDSTYWTEDKEDNVLRLLRFY